MKDIGQSRLAIFALSFFLFLCFQRVAAGQTPAITPEVSIDQTKLMTDCAHATDPNCRIYRLLRVLNSGGHLWTTPFQPYDPLTHTGDGYGEGSDGPRQTQRAYFNPNNKNYRFLRLNGLDSQSCFECHNSTGSYEVDPKDKSGALIRKPYTVAGSAGSNSNAFINPLYSRTTVTVSDSKPLVYSRVESLFIRNPPAVFGAGYTQQVGAEMTHELDWKRRTARKMALMGHKTVTIELTAKDIDFGKFTTTYIGGAQAKVITKNDGLCPVDNDANPPVGSLTPTMIGGEVGFQDDLTQVVGVSCDLVVRPFQWKGIASGLRHFVRDALEFHFSMQAFEKVGECDCDRDGKGIPVPGKPPEKVTLDDQGPEIKMGQITAMATFVAMMRPPVQAQMSESAIRGSKFFFGADGKSNCAMCHRKEFKLYLKQTKIEWPINPADNISWIDPDNDSTWPITHAQCPKGIPPAGNNFCPGEFIPGGPLQLNGKTGAFQLSANEAAMFARNPGSLVQPVAASTHLAVVFHENFNRAIHSSQLDEIMQAEMRQAQPQGAQIAAPELAVQPQFSESDLRSAIEMLDAPITPSSMRIQPNIALPFAMPQAGSVVGTDYVLDLTPKDSEVSDVQLPRLPERDGSIYVPLMSDLKRHDMGPCLTDPSFQNVDAVYSQGTDVMHITTAPREYLTRPLWGVADTGPWLHDGRALTLKDAILMHGDTASCPGSEANTIIDAFEKLKASDGYTQDDVVEFLLTLELPPPANRGPGAVKLEDSASKH